MSDLERMKGGRAPLPDPTHFVSLFSVEKEYWIKELKKHETLVSPDDAVRCPTCWAHLPIIKSR
jgi:hypothetical protein